MSSLGRLTDELNHRGAIISFFTACITVLTAVLGFQANSLSSDVDTLQHEKALLSRQLGSSRAAAQVLDETNTDLQARILELERQVPPVVQASDAPRIRTNNRVTLAAGGDTIDLDSTQMNWDAGGDHGWDADTLAYDNSDGDPTLDFGYKVLGGGVDFARLPSGPDSKPASYLTCRPASNYAPVQQYLEPSDLQDDRTCFRLDSGRYATIHVDDYTNRAVTLSITVWERGD